MRAAAYVLSLAWKRVCRRSSGALLAASGIAVGTAVLVAVLAGTKVAQDRSAAQAIERIPAASRSVRAVWFGVPPDRGSAQPALDGEVRGALRALGLPGPTPIVLFRESTVAGRFVGLAAVDGLAPFVYLRSGRLPTRCRPERCEVLRLRGEGALPNVPGLRVVQVGTAVLRSRQLFGDFLTPVDNALADAAIAPAIKAATGYHRPPTGPLVVAEGVAGLASSSQVLSSYRSYAWVWPLAAGSPRLWAIDELVHRVERARSGLSARSTSFSVAAPVSELRAAERASAVAGRRLLLVGGEAAALLFAFAVLAARGMRRDLEAARRRLTWSGARRWQLGLLTTAESAAVGLTGTVVGWLVGLGAGAVAASVADAPVGAVLRESVLAPEGLALAAATGLLATGVIVVTVSAGSRREGRFGALDAAAVAAIAVVVVALAGGAADEERLATGQGAGLILLVLPGLIAFAAAVLAARLFGPLVRLAGRVLRARLGLRLATVSLGRGPGVGAVTVAFLTLAFALSLLAEGYRATLSRGESDQAAFQVPLDIVVREDLSRLVPVLDAAPLNRFARLGAGVEAVPVLRIKGGAGQGQVVGGVTVLGLPAAAIEDVRGWRDGWGAGRSQLIAAIRPAHPVTTAGVRLAGDTIRLRAGPGSLALSATIVAPDGDYEELALGELQPRRATTLEAALPPSLRGGTLVAIGLDPPRLQDRGADAGRAFRGRLALSGLDLRGFVGEGGVGARRAGDGLELRFTISDQNVARIRAPQATDRRPPAVLATARLADLAGGVGGILPLQLRGETVPVRIAAVVDRFPGTTGEAVIGDVGLLELAVNSRSPGAGRTDEVWLDVPAAQEQKVAAALARPPFRSLQSLSRTRIEREARDDPLGHGTLVALGAAALAALVLAAIGLALAVLSDLRDDRGELYDLEAEGARPAVLRRVVRARALIVAVAGLLAGAAAGAVLALLVTRVVAVTARATAPEPPLATAFDVRVIAVGAACYLVVAGMLVLVATRHAFKGDRGPVRAQELDA